MIKSNTCIAVMKTDQGKLMFAGDRRTSWGMHKAQVGTRPKVVKRDGILFAGTGAAYVCDIICELLKVPVYNDTVDPFTFVHDTIVPQVLDILKDKKLLNTDGTALLNKDLGSLILLGFKGILFEISIDHKAITVDPVETPHTVGCGGPYALGAILAITDFMLVGKELAEGLNDEDVTNVLHHALKIAAKISPGCDDNVDIIVED